MRKASKGATSLNKVRWHVSIPLRPSHASEIDVPPGRRVLGTVIADLAGMTAPCLVEDRLVGPRGRRFPSSLLVSLLARVRDPQSGTTFRNGFAYFLAEVFFPLPVHPSRFPRVRRAARERAAEHGSSVERELLDATASAVCQLDVPATSADRPFEREARRQVNELVTRDFLGDDWRRSQRGSAPEVSDGDFCSSGFEDRVLSRLYGQELTRRAGLSPAERAVVGAALAGYSHVEIASARGLSDSTVRNQFLSAMRKYRRVFDGYA